MLKIKKGRTIQIYMMNHKLLITAIGMIAIALLSAFGLVTAQTNLNINRQPPLSEQPTPLPQPTPTEPIFTKPGTPILLQYPYAILVRILANRNILLRGIVQSAREGSMQIKSAACTWTVNTADARIIDEKGISRYPPTLPNGSFVIILGKVTDDVCTVNATLVRRMP